jgi:hypothetical protein
MDDDGGGWTVFYAGRNGIGRTYFHYLGGAGISADCPHPQFDCVRRLAADRTEQNTLFAASCGSAMIKFTADAIALKLFRDGLQSSGQNYEPIANVATIYGTVTPLPNTLYVGVQNPGWFLINYPSGPVFSAGYPAGGYAGCNNVNDIGPLASLYWREM